MEHFIAICPHYKNERDSFRQLNADKIEAVLKYNVASRLRRIMRVPSPAQNLCSYFMAMFAAQDILIPGTLDSRVVKSSLSPMNCVLIHLLEK